MLLTTYLVRVIPVSEHFGLGVCTIAAVVTTYFEVFHTALLLLYTSNTSMASDSNHTVTMDGHPCVMRI